MYATDGIVATLDTCYSFESWLLVGGLSICLHQCNHTCSILLDGFSAFFYVPVYLIFSKTAAHFLICHVFCFPFLGSSYSTGNISCIWMYVCWFSWTSLPKQVSIIMDLFYEFNYWKIIPSLCFSRVNKRIMFFVINYFSQARENNARNDPWNVFSFFFFHGSANVNLEHLICFLKEKKKDW